MGNNVWIVAVLLFTGDYNRVNVVKIGAIASIVTEYFDNVIA